MSKLSIRKPLTTSSFKFNYATVILLINFQLLIVLNVKCQEDGEGGGGGPFIYKSYQTSAYCQASHPIQYPTDGKELQSIVKSAIASKVTIKLFGSRHSVTDIICTDGIPVSTQNITYTKLNPNRGTVTVGSGAQLQDVLDYLRDNGRTLITVPSFGGITIGGALGTGAHGSSLLHPTTLSDQVVGLTIIDGMGQLKKITRDHKDLPAFRVHLGLLGALVDVTLETVPLFKMTVVNYLDKESILLDGTALREAEQYPWYELFWFPSSKSVVVSKGNYSSPEETPDIPGNAHTNFFPDLTSAEIVASRKTFEEVQSGRNLQAQKTIEDYNKKSLYTEVVGRPPIFAEPVGNGTHEQYVNPATGYAYQLQTNRCSNRCAWVNGDQSIYPEEFALAFDIDQFPNMVQRIKTILADLPAAFLMLGVWIRFTRGSDALMSINQGRDSVHIDWATPMRFDPYTQPRDRIGTYQAMQQALILELDGRPHWGKNGQYYFTRKIIRRRPREELQKFQRTMKKYDPNGLFMNNFGRRVMLQSDELTVDPKTSRCALLDYCLCGRDEDCGENQVCSKYDKRYPICTNAYNGLIPNNPFP